jgi:hypothetical protein
MIFINHEFSEENIILRLIASKNKVQLFWKVYLQMKSHYI